MHLGLEDGEPVCADYLYLTEESKERIRQVATTRMFDHEAKYQLLDTLDLEAWNVDYDEEDDMPTARNVMDKVDAFLVDIELQKQRDKERFDAMMCCMRSLLLCCCSSNHSSCCHLMTMW